MDVIHINFACVHVSHTHGHPYRRMLTGYTHTHTHVDIDTEWRPLPPQVAKWHSTSV